MTISFQSIILCSIIIIVAFLLIGFFVLKKLYRNKIIMVTSIVISVLAFSYFFNNNFNKKIDSIYTPIEYDEKYNFEIKKNVSNFMDSWSELYSSISQSTNAYKLYFDKLVVFIDVDNKNVYKSISYTLDVFTDESTVRVINIPSFNSIDFSQYPHNQNNVDFYRIPTQKVMETLDNVNIGKYIDKYVNEYINEHDEKEILLTIANLLYSDYLFSQNPQKLYLIKDNIVTETETPVKIDGSVLRITLQKKGEPVISKPKFEFIYFLE
ncbi:hypothetical protein RBH29_03305 [Herbivorax sp. ANBcel31]|uniref:hypothetical protein n=1 Tax=Herbivorax sp. ANBcel31 TaxID=3069754 RepID=UPI0027B7FC57|nr:hypothetical protein [Herbivorax sp. ANBcel31]MDQ2085458.1 hypothetical protein [Herbivorax sp. ANBcel31]